MFVMKAFISHSWADNKQIEPFVNYIKTYFGEDDIEYDVWKVKPGDSIIQFMDDGLQNFDYFFFFISKNSLSSYMVSLEWKNALILCKDKKRKFVSIILDDVQLPAILTDINHINAFAEGFNSAKNRIDQLFDNSNHINEQNINNLLATIKLIDSKIFVKLECLLFTEPNSRFAFVFNKETEARPVFDEGFFGSTDKIQIDGEERIVQFVGLMRSLTVGNPFCISFSLKTKPTYLSIMQVWDNNGQEKGNQIPIKVENN